MNVDMQTVMHSLELMGKGMLAIFVVIVAIYLLAIILWKVTSRKKKSGDE